MQLHERRHAMLGIEFERYGLDHPAFAARIPRGAQIVLPIPQDPKFDAWASRLAARQHESGTPVVVVTIGRWRPAMSRLVGPRLQMRAA